MGRLLARVKSVSVAPKKTLSALIWSALIWALEAIAPIIRAARKKADHFRSAHLKLNDNFLVQGYFDLR